LKSNRLIDDYVGYKDMRKMHFVEPVEEEPPKDDNLAGKGDKDGKNGDDRNGRNSNLGA